MGEATRRTLPILAGPDSPRTDSTGARGTPTTVLRPETASLWAALHEVMDPEFPISVVDLGLIYEIRRAGPRVEVELTFTATACPCMDFIQDDTRERLLQEPGVEEVVIDVVWDPPWTTDRITEAGRATLRRYGVGA